MRVLSVNAGADTGGLSIGMKRAFDQHSTVPFRSLIRSSNYIRYPMDAAWSRMRELVAEADVLHLHNSFRTLSLLPGRGRGKGLVLYNHGSMFRRNPEPILHEARQRRAVMLASCLDIWSLAPDEMQWIPAAYDIDWLQRIRQEHYQPHQGLIIAHAPTDRASKGTQALIEAVDRLKGSYPIKLLLIEGRSWQQTLALKATADIFVDQLLLGYGCNGIEAMGMGIPVISGVDFEAGRALQHRHPELRVPPGTMDAMLQHWGELPYLHATQRSIKQALEAMIADAKVRAEYATKGLRHFQRFHADEVVVPQLERVYEQSLSAAGVEVAA